MAVRIELDCRQGPTVPRVARSPEGALHLVLTRAHETIVLQLTYPSLEALRWELTAAIPAVIRTS
jgi:hypothetical protein